MGYKERVIYILKIIVLICIIVWLLYTDRERYVEEYNAKIEALEQKVDSLHGINDELTFKIDTLNTQIKGLDKEISLKNSRINNLKYEISTKVDAVDSFNDDELERFFTERYRELLDSIAKPIAKLVIKDLITGDGAKEELVLTTDKINLLEQKIVLKDSVINSLELQVNNFNAILSTKTDQLAISQELSKKLQTDLKKQKLKTKLMGGVGLVAVGAAIIILK